MPRSAKKAVKAATPTTSVNAKPMKRKPVKRRTVPGMKRPLSSYNLFRADIIDQIRKDKPGLKMVENNKLVSEQWKALADDVKSPYTKKAAELRAEYKKKLDALPPLEPEEEKDTVMTDVVDEEEDASPAATTVVKPRKKKIRLEGEPKRALNGFMLFRKDRYDDVKEENPSMKGSDIAKELGKLWSALSDDDKEPYVKEKTRLKEVYTKAKAAFDAKFKLFKEANPDVAGEELSILWNESKQKK